MRQEKEGDEVEREACSVYRIVSNGSSSGIGGVGEAGRREVKLLQCDHAPFELIHGQVSIRVAQIKATSAMDQCRQVFVTYQSDCPAASELGSSADRRLSSSLS